MLKKKRKKKILESDDSDSDTEMPEPFSKKENPYANMSRIDGTHQKNTIKTPDVSPNNSIMNSPHSDFKERFIPRIYCLFHIPCSEYGVSNWGV